MDFRIKIDLSSQSIIENIPTNNKKKKRFDRSKKRGQGQIKSPEICKRRKQVLKMDKKENLPIQPKEIPQQQIIEKPKLNSCAILSLTLPYNENSKTDQAQKLSMITKKKPRHWEKRWVLIPNVFEFTKEIWLKKWVLVDGGDDISDNNVSLNKILLRKLKFYDGVFIFIIAVVGKKIFYFVEFILMKYIVNFLSEIETGKIYFV